MDKYLEFVLEKAKEVFTTDDITPESNFKDDLGATSIVIANLMNEIEDEYDVTVPYMQFRRCLTIQDAAEFVKTLVEGDEEE